MTTEYGQGLAQIEETLRAVHELGMQTVWLWPNVDAGSDQVSKGIRLYRERRSRTNIHFYINFAVEEVTRVVD